MASVLTNGAVRIAVFREAFDRIDVATYVHYKSTPVRTGGDGVAKHGACSYHVGDKLVYELRWSRPRLRRVAADAPHYATLDVVVGSSEVLSLHVQAPEPSWLDEHVPALLDGLRITAPVTSAWPRFGTARGRAASLAPAARALLARLDDEPRQWGVFEPGAPLSSDTLFALERDVDFRFPFLLVYTTLATPNVGAQLRAAAALGRTVELTLQTPKEGGAPTYFYDLLDGAHDAGIRAYAREVAEFGEPVLFRLNNEMNGDWCRYCAYWTSQDPELFCAAWHHVFRVFADEGAANALWVWNPHDRSFPAFRYNHAALYYPGDEVVDVVGLTGYNNGTYYPGEVWRGFDEIYAPLYAEYAAMFPGKPFVITEFACSGIGGDKAAWIRDALRRIQSYPRIRLAIWWNGIDRDGDRIARPYRLEQPEDLAAFREAIGPYRDLAG